MPSFLLGQATNAATTAWQQLRRWFRALPGEVRKRGLEAEVSFWDCWLQTRGGQWPEDFANRLNPQFPLQEELAQCLPPNSKVHILDVGAGPLTWVGKIPPAGITELEITAVDLLADHWDRLLEKYGITPLVRTIPLATERLTSRFQHNTFDLVCARNCIDHSDDPIACIHQMLAVVKKGCYVAMFHQENEGANENYQGLHQWNFFLADNGDFLLSSRKGTVTNLSQLFSPVAEVSTHRQLHSRCLQAYFRKR